MANIQHHKITVFGNYQSLVNLKEYSTGEVEDFDLEKMEGDLPQLYQDMVKKNKGFYSFESTFDIVNNGKAEIWFQTKWAVAYPYISMLSARFKDLVFILEASDDVLNNSMIWVFHRGLTLVEVDLEIDVLMARGLTREEAQKVIDDRNK